MIRGNGELPRAPSGAFFASRAAKAPGSDFARPSNNNRPFSSTTQAAVSFRETSNATYCFIVMSSRWYRDQSATSEATGICCSNYVIVWNIDPSAG
jgi:hypothetical protein